MSPKSSAMVFSTAKSKIVKTLLFSIFVNNYKSMRSTKISGLVHFWSKMCQCFCEPWESPLHWERGVCILAWQTTTMSCLTTDQALPHCHVVDLYHDWTVESSLKYLTSIWEIVLWIWYNIFCGYDFSFCKHIF